MDDGDYTLLICRHTQGLILYLVINRNIQCAKAQFLSGGEIHPAIFALGGSNWSNLGGNEVVDV